MPLRYTVPLVMTLWVHKLFSIKIPAFRGTHKPGLTISLAIVLSAGAAAVHAAETLGEALVSGSFGLDVRARHEMVDQDSFERRAVANTVRTRITYESGSWHGASALIEAENIAALGDDRFNDGINRRSDFPIVRDAPNTELNQYWLRLALPGTGALKLGRQTIDLGARTFVASARFRQNQQTYDAATITVRPLPDVTAFYGFTWMIDRTAGEDAVGGDWNTATHMAHLAYDGLAPIKLVGYAMAMDFDERPRLSSITAGARLDARVSLSGTLDLIAGGELAWQTNHADNLDDFDEFLTIAEAGLGIAGLAAIVGYRRQSGNGAAALQTTLGVKHYNRGWADKFSVTPLRGLVDTYADVTIELPDLVMFDFADAARSWLDRTRIRAAYHRFSADGLGSGYGEEFDIGIRQRVGGPVEFLLEYADYRAKGLGADTRKMWVTLQFKL